MDGTWFCESTITPARNEIVPSPCCDGRDLVSVVQTCDAIQPDIASKSNFVPRTFQTRTPQRVSGGNTTSSSNTNTWYDYTRTQPLKHYVDCCHAWLLPFIFYHQPLNSGIRINQQPHHYQTSNGVAWKEALAQRWLLNLWRSHQTDWTPVPNKCPTTMAPTHGWGTVLHVHPVCVFLTVLSVLSAQLRLGQCLDALQFQCGREPLLKEYITQCKLSYLSIPSAKTLTPTGDHLC